MPKTDVDRIARTRAARDYTRVALALLCGITVITVATLPDRAPPHAELALEPEPEPMTRSAVRVRPIDVGQRSIVQDVALDHWYAQIVAEQPVFDVVVDESGLALLTEYGVAWEMLVPDIDAVAAAERERLQRPEAQRPTDWFREYHEFEAIHSRLKWLASEHPELVSLSVFGTSIEGRPLLALEIGGHGENAVPMLINGGQHAREWIAAIVPICVAERLIDGQASDASLQAFVESTKLWVVPVVNPDGYQYSWNSDRYWRKNRRDEHGVDLNRNFGVGFGGEGSSSNKRSQTYRGSHAFSEPESAALRHLARRESIAVHIDFHSYGQLLLHPWAHTKEPVGERARFAAIGDRMASAMFAAHGERYDIRSGAELYPAAGTMSDWMYGEVEATSFTDRASSQWRLRGSCCRPNRSARLAMKPSPPCSSCAKPWASKSTADRQHRESQQVQASQRGVGRGRTKRSIAGLPIARLLCPQIGQILPGPREDRQRRLLAPARRIAGQRLEPRTLVHRSDRARQIGRILQSSVERHPARGIVDMCRVAEDRRSPPMERRCDPLVHAIDRLIDQRMVNIASDQSTQPRRDPLGAAQRFLGFLGTSTKDDSAKSGQLQQDHPFVGIEHIIDGRQTR